MIFTIFNTVAPVFLVILIGYVAARRGFFSSEMVDGLMKFAIQLGIPCILFKATAYIDFGAAYDLKGISSYYISALAGFTLASVMAHRFFGRRPGESVAVGFSALFGNLVLLGLPIIERALGPEALPTAYAVISLNAPICYLVGITSMELLRADGRTLVATSKVVVNTMFRNNLMIGIGLGLMFNLSGLTMHEVPASVLDMLVKASLPVALVALGGVLTRYKLSAEWAESAAISAIALIVTPLFAFILTALLGVEHSNRVTIILLASMSPGVNAYLFASMYQRGQGTAANTVLLSTIAAVLSVSAWLWVLNVSN